MYSTSDAPAPDSVYANFKTIRRNGSVVAFEPGKISVAMSKAFLAVAGSQGGDQQISSRISCNEIDLLLYFRNPIGAKATEPDEASLLRLCDVYNIPYATNIASAEAMIHALENGDLDWRDIVNPKK